MATHTITEDEFLEKYRPLKTDEGDIRLFSPHSEEDRPMVLTAIAERRLWTMHHGEYDSTYFWSGPHFVNRLAYVICEVPFEEGEDIGAEDPDQLPSWHCEWCDAEYDEVSRERYDELCTGIPCGTEGCKGDPDRDEAKRKYGKIVITLIAPIDEIPGLSSAAENFLSSLDVFDARFTDDEALLAEDLAIIAEKE